LAYSSERGENGGLDIWLQQVSGGLPMRLTDNPADDIEPTFSPDGTTIAYRAEGEVDGVYLVPALAGKRTLLARGGYRPRYSPDGTRVAYWTGGRTFRSSKIFIVPSIGGSAVQFAPEFRYAAYPIWSPDGRRIAFVGSKGSVLTEERNSDEWDWWVAPISGGPAVPTSARKTLERQGLLPPEADRSHLRIVPDCWTASGHLVFAARSGDQTNVWQLPISTGSWQVNGLAEQLTFGSGRQDNPSVAADGALVFSVLTHKSDVWALPIRSDSAEPRGSPVRLTSGEGDYLWPFVSRDGSRLVFVSRRTGSSDVWEKDLKTGRERALTATREDKTSPILSPDGSMVAFGYPPSLSESIFVVPFSGGKITQLCSDCGEPRTWLADGTGLLYQKLTPKGNSLVGALNLSGHTTPLLQSSESALFSSSVSRDGKWLALVVRTPPKVHRIMVVPLRNSVAAAESDWISVTEPDVWVDKPRWSPSGNLLYYVSDRDGFVCIWATSLDPATKKPLSPPKPVLHFHASNHSIENIYRLELSVADDKLVFNVGETSGDIWLATAAGR
jgi:Tol biopolymer transport system component